MRKKQKTETKPQTLLLPNDLRAISLMDKHITKSLYGLDYEYNTSLRVIGAALRMQKGYLQKVGKLERVKGSRVSKPHIRDTSHL
jgi:hypothetical protein